MLEEFRTAGVRFYEGWLIVKVVDHRNVAANYSPTGLSEEEKPFSIHNYNQYITPSPAMPFSIREKFDKSPPMKREHSDDRGAESVVSLPTNQNQQQVLRSFLTALRPTTWSRQVDLMLDFVAEDPKSKKPQKDPRLAAVAPPTPIGTVPPTPAVEKPPPLKKRKLRIDPRDHLEYEAKITNGTAPPLYLEPADDFDDMLRIHRMLEDPHCVEAPISPRSRKRTEREVAADDAYAKAQEQFMLILDPRGTNGAVVNAGAVDAQAGSLSFNPRFDKFNALETIKRELKERQDRDQEQRLQEDEMRRQQQQQINEENVRRQQQQAIMNNKQEKIRNAQLLQQQRQNAEALALAQQQHQHQQAQLQSALSAQRPNTAARPQPNGIPPQMQNQIAAHASSPIMRQGTPHAASSPIINTGRPMMRTVSQAGAGSPPRPGSSLQHAHPMAQNMARQASNQGGPSGNGTPQISHGTPGMPTATPIMRQGTPSHPLTQPSPAGQVLMSTPQLNQAMMQPQMMNGNRQLHPQQIAELQRRQAQQQAMQATQMQIQNGQSVTQAQLAAYQAHRQAQMDRNVAMSQQQQAQAQAAMQNAGQPQMGMSPNLQAGQQAYKDQMAQQLKQRMQTMNNAQGSPAPQPQMTPQQVQQVQQMQAQNQARAQQQGHAQAGQPGQPGQARPNPQVAGLIQKLQSQLFQVEVAKYGSPDNVPPQVKQQIATNARTQASRMLFAQRQAMNNMQQNGMTPQNPQQLAMMQQLAAQQQANIAATGGNPAQQMNPQLMAQLQNQQAQARQQQQQQQQQQMAHVQQQMMAQNVAQNYQQQMMQMAQAQNPNGQQGGRQS